MIAPAITAPPAAKAVTGDNGHAMPAHSQDRPPSSDFV